MKPTKKFDVLSETSDKSGFAWLVESFLRKFRNLAFFLFFVPVVGLCAFAMSLSVLPGVYFFKYVMSINSDWAQPLQYLSIACALVAGFFMYGMTLIFVAPAFNFLLPLKLRAWRGMWFSVQSIPWYFHNSLIYMVRYTFLEFITPSPWNILFFKMMGMKIGKGVTINTSNISDACLIELDDYVTIGGSAHLLAHYGQKGFLILSPIKIGKNSTVGLKASVMGGAQIGEDCTIRPHVAVLPNTIVPDGEVV